METTTLIFWLSVLAILIFILFLLRRYIRKVLVIFLVLAMVFGLFYLLNPSGAKSLIISLQNFSWTGTSTTLVTDLEESVDEVTGEIVTETELSQQYSRFASLFGKKPARITIEEVVVTGAVSTDAEQSVSVELASGTVVEEVSTSKLEEASPVLDSQIVLDNQIAAQEVVFDANRYEVKTVGDKIIISAKTTSTVDQKTASKTEPDEDTLEDEDEVIMLPSNPQPSKSTTPKSTQSSSSLTQKDLQEAHEIFGI